MAELTDEEREFASYVDELEAEGEQVMEAAERDDQAAQKQAQAKKAEHSEEGVVTKSEYMADKFLATASEDEARLFAIYRRGDEDPRQLKGIIELAKTKAAEAAKASSEEVEEKAEKLADQKASAQYGISPLGNGTPSRQETPQEIFDRTREQAVKARDTRTLGSLFINLPPDAE